jgi:deoxyribose-phosphate aldolase
MESEKLARYIDLTLLKPEATAAQVSALCADAVRHGVYAVCVSPSLVGVAARKLSDYQFEVLPITVVGFPSGATTRRSKAYETRGAVNDGAREIDMVMNLGLLKERELSRAQDEIAETVEAARRMPVKVIIESAALTEDEILLACDLAGRAGAAFVKTSTGFHPAGGATVDAVRLMRGAVGRDLGVKASGGIKTREQALAFIGAGATRIGCSDVSRILVRGEPDPHKVAIGS